MPQQIGRETTVVDVERPAILVSMPDAGPKNEDIAYFEFATLGRRDMESASADDNGDLDKTVCVRRVVFFMNVMPGVCQRIAGKFQ
jgi:hypothetical protein